MLFLKGVLAAQSDEETQLEKAAAANLEEPTSSAAVQGKSKSSGGGLTYIRWGHDKCPKGVELLYSGLMAGTYYGARSGGSNYQCLPNKPQYALPYRRGVQNTAWLFGTEYYHSMVGKNSQNVPCAQCYVPTRSAKFTNPAAASCPSGWTREYFGYLMTVRFWHDYEYSTYECVDKEQRSIPGSQGCKYGSFLTYVEAHCNGPPCPPYDHQKELNCVVCTK